MEIEKEPKRSGPGTTSAPQTTTKSEPQKIYQAQPTQTFIPFTKSYAQEVCLFMGTIFVLVGLIGFVVDNFLGAHLSYTHNSIHVASGVLSLWFGFDSLKNAKIFSWVLGTIYFALGVAGFILGKPGIPSMGTLAQDSFLWKLYPEVLELGKTDHILHVIFGATFLLGGIVMVKRFQKI